MKNKNVVYLFLIASITNILAILIIYPVKYVMTNQSLAQTTQIEIMVFDAHTQKPIENATVCIGETGERFSTNSLGKTPIITIPFLKGADYIALARPYGEITILVFKEGYVDFILFNAITYQERTRKGPHIGLYENDGTLSLMTLIESPPNDFVKELVQSLRPKG